jgi:drug/metabolite transporter superfamily protein YnfA
MNTLHIFSIFAWISLPTVMFGGYALLRLLSRGALSEFQLTYFRAGHAHAGVLILMSLLYIQYIEQTNLSPTVKIAAAVVLVIGVLAQSGGFFLHMFVGQPGAPSVGTTVTTIGAVLLAAAVAVLVYGLIVSR